MDRCPGALSFGGTSGHDPHTRVDTRFSPRRVAGHGTLSASRDAAILKGREPPGAKGRCGRFPDSHNVSNRIAICMACITGNREPRVNPRVKAGYGLGLWTAADARS